MGASPKSAYSGSGPSTVDRGKNPVLILRGRLRGREGWIAGTLEDRAARGITKAIVHVEGELPDLYVTSSLEEARQLPLFDPPNAKRTAAGA